ncbi:rho GTPase-activating protein conundrum-like [Penaeus monodon]|uniref:rho GTPase-activating protein conundrum-like n=1 Tax=Penaeus monodon TaxID=6687 RepID=UPI0018A7D802|nr:rho GTPase-activating protein conundrum-like [Penaeus monodon]
MESFASVELEDYFNEVRAVSRRTSQSNSQSEEEVRSHEDDGESDEHFLEELGIPVKQDSELSEDNVTYSKFMGTLNPLQEEALKRRVRTLNATIRRKKQRQKPDIRNFFANTDNSSTGTRSRSATPDSLDSVSPPRTPPDPHPKSWVDPYLSRSRGSLDSGNHSLVTSPSVITSPTPFTLGSMCVLPGVADAGYII